MSRTLAISMLALPAVLLLAVAAAAPLTVAQARQATSAQVQPVRRTPSPRATPALPDALATPTRTVTRPSAMPTLRTTPAQPAQLPTQPGFLTVTPVRPPNPPTGLPALTPAATLGAVTRVAEYAAADAITAFAAQHLGLSITVARAAGATGALTLPAAVQAEIDAAAALAGQVSIASITAGSARGAAEVAVGSGGISGDLNADISSASLGAYSLLVVTAPPRSSAAALDVIRSVYPSLAATELMAVTGNGAGYTFQASTVVESMDPRTRTVTAVVQEVLAGVIGQGRATLVWAVIGNGDFAAALALP